MIKGFLNLPWFLWAGIALIIAVIYTFVWPHKTTGIAGFRFFVLRWGHALTWFLLTLNFLLRGIDPSLNGLASLIALAGGLMYLLFMMMTFVVK
jgi:hypothetical protein